MAVSVLRTALVAFGDETTRLAGGTARVWLRLLPRLLSLTLLGWVAYYGAVFVGAVVARFSPWLLIPALSLGVVLRLATVVVALRSVATELGAPALLEQVAPAEVVSDDRDRSLSRLLGITLLPFLAVYAAFGYVDTFARDVVLLSTYRFEVTRLLPALNPLDSPAVGIATVVLVVVLFVARRLLDRWQERSGRLLPGLLAALVEAGGRFVVLLSAFRLVEGASLWLGERRVAQWWQAGLDGATGWLRFDLPDLVVRAWTFLAETIWPVFWEVLSQPVAWLALAALVFGSRVLSLGDLLHSGAPSTEVRPGRTQRAREALARAAGPRRGGLPPSVPHVERAGRYGHRPPAGSCRRRCAGARRGGLRRDRCHRERVLQFRAGGGGDHVGFGVRLLPAGGRLRFVRSRPIRHGVGAFRGAPHVPCPGSGCRGDQSGRDRTDSSRASRLRITWARPEVA